jgi:PAS domain S-box-containing protein
MSPHHGMPKGHLPVCSYLAAPVVSRTGEPIGGLFFGHPEPGRFTQRAERLAVGIAAQAAIAIEIVRLFSKAGEELERRKAAEGAKLLLAAIVDSSDDAIVSKDLKGIITSWNQSAQRLFGYTAEEAVGRSVAELLIPEDRQEEEPNILRRLARGERVDHFETIRRHKDGTFLDISLTISPVKDPDGVIVGASKIARDITQRKKAAEQLRASEERFRQLADSMPQIVWTAGPDGQVDYYNARWYEFTGLPEGDLQHGLSIVHPEDLDRCVTLWLRSVQTGEQYYAECRFRVNRANTWRWFIVRALPARDCGGRIVKWFGTSTDIDEQKNTEDELRRANLDLEQFAYSASHDLQEPLRTIKIYAELLTGGQTPLSEKESADFRGYLRTAASRMESLVKDLLAYTRINQLQQPVEASDANDALANALANLGGAIAESGARVTFEELPGIRIHSMHLQQLFQNLLGNSIKYRDPERPPAIHVAAEQQADMCIVSVRDNGIGIAPAYKEQIFGLFSRLHSRDSYSGTGIGLAICQRIIERYRGRIWVESKPGCGSTFRFSVPV